MKERYTAIMLIVLSVLLIAGCSTESSSSSQRIRMVGTAKAVSMQTTRSTGEKFDLDSIDKVIVNGSDITDQLTPSNPESVTDGMSNVEFQADIEVFSKTSFEAAAKPGFVFDEWEVVDPQGRKSRESRVTDKIENWLEVNGCEHSEKIYGIPSEYISYLVAEYDRGYYVTLGEKAAAGDGTADKPFSVEELFAELNRIRRTDELTLIISGNNESELGRLITGLNGISSLKEIKLKADGAMLSVLPECRDAALSGFRFSNLTINDSSSEYEFRNCEFEMLIIENAGEIEFKGGKAENFTVVKAEEIDIKSMIIGKLDLSRMTEGEIEIKNSEMDFYIAPESKQVDVEIVNNR